MWEDLGVRARLTVQIATKIYYGIPFCRADFNLEGGADGLSFVTGAEIRKLEKIICDGDFNYDRVNKATVIAADIVNPVFQRQATIMFELENNASFVLDEIA